jgi:hypothetical protein
VLAPSARVRRRPAALLASLTPSVASALANCPAPRLLATFPRAAVGATAGRRRAPSPELAPTPPPPPSTRGEANCTPVPRVVLARPHIAAGEPSRCREGTVVKSRDLVVKKPN